MLVTYFIECYNYVNSVVSIAVKSHIKKDCSMSKIFKYLTKFKLHVIINK